jgi:hypothetical protein
MSDFDEVTITVQGKEVMSLKPNIEDPAGVVGGSIICRDQFGKVAVAIHGGTDSQLVGGGSLNLINGPLRLVTPQGKTRVMVISGDELQNADGGIIVLDAAGDSQQAGALGSHSAIVLNAAKRSIVIHGASGNPIVEIGPNGQIRLGGGGANGGLVLHSNTGKERINLRGDLGDCRLGGDGASGDLLLFGGTAKNADSSDKAAIHLRASDATMRVGGNGKSGDLLVLNSTNKPMVHIDGESGDILLENADCAEDFDVDDPLIEPGSVLIFSDEPGRLRASDTPYDTRVAGILSGAGSYRPAIVLDRKPGREGRRPVALMGKAWCKVEAGSAPIRVGSLLTTSSLPGHAMAATDRERAFGAVLGKALAPLANGVGIVPVLVALQ